MLVLANPKRQKRECGYVTLQESRDVDAFFDHRGCSTAFVVGIVLHVSEGGFSCENHACCAAAEACTLSNAWIVSLAFRKRSLRSGASSLATMSRRGSGSADGIP